MNKKFMKIVIGSLIGFLIVVYVINWAFFDIQRIKGQEKILESTSPNGTYTISAYLNNGGATTSYAVLGSLKNNETNKQKNIYWEYRCEEAEIEWIDDFTVKINNVVLDVRKDTYDFRDGL